MKHIVYCLFIEVYKFSSGYLLRSHIERSTYYLIWYTPVNSFIIYIHSTFCRINLPGWFWILTKDRQTYFSLTSGGKLLWPWFGALSLLKVTIASDHELGGLIILSRDSVCMKWPSGASAAGFFSPCVKSDMWGYLAYWKAMLRKIFFFFIMNDGVLFASGNYRPFLNTANDCFKMKTTMCLNVVLCLVAFWVKGGFKKLGISLPKRAT